MLSVYLYILIVMIAILLIFIARQVRLRRTIAERRARRVREAARHAEE